MRIGIYDFLNCFDDLERKDFTRDDILNSCVSSEGLDKDSRECKNEFLVLGLTDYLLERIVAGDEQFVMVHGVNVKEYFLRESMMDYLLERSEAVEHPVLKANYLKVICTLSKTLTGIDTTNDIYIKYIDSVIDIANGGYFNDRPYESFAQLRLALSYAIRRKLSNKIEECKQSIITLERNYGSDKLAGTWAHSYDILLKENKPKKINLTEEDKSAIIGSLEERLHRLVQIQSEDPVHILNIMEKATERLIEYYQKSKELEKLNAVISKLESSYNLAIEACDPIRRNELFDKMLKLFSDKSKRDEIQRRKRANDKELSSMMIPFTIKHKIDKERILNIISIIKSADNDDLKLYRISSINLPTKESLKRFLYESGTADSFLFRFTGKSDRDQNGREVASIGTIGSDEENRILSELGFYLSQSLQETLIIINNCIENQILSEELMFKLIKESDFFDEERYPIVLYAVKQYFSNCDAVFLHLIIPQIEEGFRRKLEMLDGNTYSNKGDSKLIALNEILNKEEIINYFEEDTIDLAKIILTESRGLNLRNRICHGLISLSEINNGNAHRVLQLLIRLLLVDKIALHEE